MKRSDFVVKGEVLDILSSVLYECKQWKGFVDNPELLGALQTAIRRVEEIPEPALTWNSLYECENCNNFDDSKSEFGECQYSGDCFICRAWTGQGFAGVPSMFRERREEDA